MAWKLIESEDGYWSEEDLMNICYLDYYIENNKVLEDLHIIEGRIVRTLREQKGLNVLSYKIRSMYEYFNNRIEKELGYKGEIHYSAYEDDDNGIPIDNLDEIAIFGKVTVKEENIYEVWSGDLGKPFVSELVENPTWLDLLVIAQKQIEVTNNYHHVYLEGWHIVSEQGEFKTIEFDLGS